MVDIACVSPWLIGSSKHEVSDFEDPSSDFPFMVPAESLQVASGVDDGCLVSLLE